MAESIEIDSLFWFRIKVYTKRGGEMVETLYWELLPFQVRTKWDWYFKYRAALLQVKYPRYEVDMHWGNTKKTDAEAIQIRNSIISLKGKITKISNKIGDVLEETIMMRANWNQLFPIEEDAYFMQLHTRLANLDVMLKETKNELLLKESQLEQCTQVKK